MFESRLFPYFLSVLGSILLLAGPAKADPARSDRVHPGVVMKVTPAPSPSPDSEDEDDEADGTSTAKTNSNDDDEDEVESPLTGSLSFVSDYYSRGMTQTNHQPAVQGEFDWADPTGIRLGVWGSNVGYPESQTQLELDLSAGYAYQISRHLEAVLSVVRGTYFESEGRDAWSFPLEVNYRDWTFTVEYSPRWEGLPDEAWYFSAAWNSEVGPGIKVGALAGYSLFPDGSSIPNYPHFEAKVGHEFVGLDWFLIGEFVRKIEIPSVSSDSDDEEETADSTVLTESRAIVSVSKSF